MTRFAGSVGACLGVLMFAVRADAGVVTLAWDPNSESNLGGYYLAYGTAPGGTDVMVDVGLATTWQLNLADGHTYYFRVYAYSIGGGTSAPSAEVSTTLAGASSSWWCPGVAPGVGWVCINGGWLPPDSPALQGGGTTSGGAPSGGSTAGCIGTAPVAGWVCINGGWIPPDWPGALGGSSGSPAPSPVQTPATSCLGTAPVAGWVCVNGGWIPPDWPEAQGAGSGGSTSAGTGSAGSSTGSTSGSCIGSPPGAGWVCVGGGWVPPDHPLARGGG